MTERNVTLSVVSHGQNVLVNQLLADVQCVCAERVSLIVTENIPDKVPLVNATAGHSVKVIRNTQVKGFGANHNAAFTYCSTDYFCVCNPDIRLLSDPFPVLVEALSVSGAGVVGPLVCDAAGAREDSARRFPTARSLLKKLFVAPSGPDYPTNRGAIKVDWCAGMFMLFSSDAYRAVGGFDEEYFLYYEDVDICQRLGAAGKGAIFAPSAKVIHEARRGSRRNPLLAVHHLRSACRYLARRPA